MISQSVKSQDCIHMAFTHILYIDSMPLYHSVGIRCGDEKLENSDH